MGLATGVNAETAAKLRARRRRWVAVGVGLVAVILIASVIASLLFSRAGSDSVVGRVDTSVAGTLAPEFELPGLTGRTSRLQQFQGSSATEFAVRGVPETYVVGRDGRLAGKIIGRLRDGQLDAVISDLLQPSSIKGSTSQSGQ